MIDPRELMRVAIAKTQDGIRAGQSPFGCAIANESGIVAVAHNTVVQSTDITAHAEVNAIRLANSSLGEIHLGGCIVATTCEPCPMCTAALHWARVDTVYYGASIADAETAGFNELNLAAAELLHVGGSQVKLVGNTMTQQCQALFAEWLENPHRKPY